MEKLWYKFNIDTTNAVRDDLDMSFVAGPDPESHWVWGCHGDNMKNILNEEWIEYCKSKEFEIIYLMLFYKPANFNDNIHTDDRPTFIPGEYFLDFGLNFVINPGYMSGNGTDIKYKDWQDTGTFEWYKREPEKEVYREGEFAGYRYSHLHIPKTDDLTLLDSLNFDKDAYIIHAGKPHQVFTKDQPRLSVSLRTRAISNVSTWEQTIEHFRQHNLIFDR
jgi:hypothetical protein